MIKKTFIIAEIAQAHDGNITEVHNYIDALSKTGIDIIKFQTHIAVAESSIYEPFRIKFSERDKTRFDYWKRMEFSFEQWVEIKEHCNQVGIEFMSSPFSNAAVDLLEKVGVKRYKVGSGEVSNFLLLEKLAQTKKPIIVSTGMSSYDELDKTAQFLRARNISFSLLQCTTSYPTVSNQWGLNVIEELKKRYQVPIGFSDHSSSIEACIAAVVLGAEIIEFHAVFDKNSKGPDAKSSLTINEISQLVKAVRNIENAIKKPVNKNKNELFHDLKQIFEKSLAVNKNLKEGHILSFNDLEAKKPKGYGISADKFELIIGKKLLRNMKQWEFLNMNDIE
ncbi:N-acetylneuraminate synthase family protein [Lutibacter flavus]|uniref:N-acetylneuraminate synthase n=1 Tax=Lutibacter flavus TaxID=691689 RepID=A0A238VQT3_9FLAO|nr:N-acetylneuraminate synthase family protein [Lutibacter flavus]SNR36541.1 N-acetylneuraminate synthase [Lutibacter flavus]